MRFIKRSNLVQDLEGVPNEVKKSIFDWLNVISEKEKKWQNFNDVLNTYRKTSQVGELYVFRFGKGYRLIVGINFKRQIVFYKTLLSHAEYEKGVWKTKYFRSR